MNTPKTGVASSVQRTQEKEFTIFLSKSLVRVGKLSLHALQTNVLILDGTWVDQIPSQNEWSL